MEYLDQSLEIFTIVKGYLFKFKFKWFVSFNEVIFIRFVLPIVGLIV